MKCFTIFCQFINKWTLKRHKTHKNVCLCHPLFLAIARKYRKQKHVVVVMKTDLNSKKKGPQDYQTLKIELFLVNLEKTGNKHVVVLKKNRS